MQRMCYHIRPATIEGAKAISQLNASELKYETAAEQVEQTLSSFSKAKGT